MRKLGTYIILAVSGVLFTLNSVAQNRAVATNGVQVTKEQPATYICEDIKNTYQIQLNSRKEIAIPTNICDLIIQNRHKTEVVYHKINDFAVVKILPESEIRGTKLKELKDYIHKFSDPE